MPPASPKAISGIIPLAPSGTVRIKSLYGQALENYSTVLNWRANAPIKYVALPKSDEESQDVELVTSQPSSGNKKENASPIQRKSSDDRNDKGGLMQSVLAWTCMALAILAGASIGPVFKYMMAQAITPLLAASWRNQTMVLALLPMAMLEAYRGEENRVAWFSIKPGLPFPIIVHVFISGLAWAANLLFWIIGLQYISTFKASVVASSHPVLLVVAMRLSGHPVSFYEYLGVFVAFGGMFLSEYKGAMHAADGVKVPFRLQMYGLFLCFLAAVGEVITIFNRMKTRKYVPLLQVEHFYCT
jgi:hypothetical protein